MIGKYESSITVGAKKKYSLINKYFSVLSFIKKTALCNVSDNTDALCESILSKNKQLCDAKLISTKKI